MARQLDREPLWGTEKEAGREQKPSDCPGELGGGGGGEPALSRRV